MVAHEKRNSGQLFCTVPTRNDLALSSLLFTAQPTKKLGYPTRTKWYGSCDVTCLFYLSRPKRLLNLATRPPVSTSFCLPVKKG